MKLSTRSLTLLFAGFLTLFTAFRGLAQVAINITGSAPHASAILDVTSTAKGVLIPRMATAERDLIASPATGLMIYNTTNNKYNFYSGVAWVELASGSSSRIIDTDLDTKVDVETSPDADYISMRVAGNEIVAIINNRIEMFFPGGSIAIGEEAGSQDDGTANFNTTLGTSAGASLISGEHNVNIGTAAGSNNSSGNDNTYLGFNSGIISQSSNNLFAGAHSGETNTTGFDNTFLGKDAGRLNSTGAQNVFVGMQAGSKNTTSSNTFLGAFAGMENTSGAGNTFIGKDAGKMNTTAANNLYVGFDAGRTNTIGNNNVFLGKDAGRLNAVGNFNVMIGSGAGLNNTVTGNTFVGASAGSSNTTGASNTFLGFGAGSTNFNTSFNTMIGTSAGANNELGEKNTFVGVHTGQDNQGSFNTFLGAFAGEINQTGAENTFVGELAGHTNSTGSNNTFLGRKAGHLNATASGNTFVGRNAGMSNVTGASNTFIGQNAGTVNKASNNTFIGQNAGNANTSATENTFIGQDAGRSNTTGARNTFVGTKAGAANTLGLLNVFVGDSSGVANISAGSNTFIGGLAGRLNTTGGNNTFLGANAGSANTTSAFNTFLGSGAGSVNTIGSSNTFVGHNAGLINSAGTKNAFMGQQSGNSNTTGSNNVFVGEDAAQNNNTGSFNVIIGQNAAPANTSGSHNTFVGFHARPGSGTLTNATAIGDSALVNASNTVVLGNNARVGMGTSNPNVSAKVEISSTTQGFLMPRMTTSQRNAIVSPAPGLMVFDLDKAALYFFDGVAWLPIAYTPQNSLPPIVRISDDSQVGDFFGSGVAISGDYAIVGASGYDDVVAGFINQGAAFIFKRTNGSWIQEATLMASDANESDLFGTSVDIFGDYAIAGAPGDEAGKGAAYIFIRTGSTWTQQAKITAATGAASDKFGTSVSMTDTKAIIGAPNDDIAANTDVGSVHVFNRSGTTWTSVQVLLNGESGDNQLFGHSVSLTQDYLAIGAPGNGTNQEGRVYVYVFGGGTWTSQFADTGDDDDNLGYSVSIKDDYMAAGLPQESAPGHGKVKIYKRIGSTWNVYGTLSGTATGGTFGSSVAINEDFLIIGNTYAHKTMVYSNDSTSYTFLREIVDTDPGSPYRYLGYSSEVDGFNVLTSSAGTLCGFCTQFPGQVYFLNLE